MQADINGASLIVFFDDGNPANNRDVYLRSTNDSTNVNAANTDPDDWTQTLTGVVYGIGASILELHVGDGQVGALLFHFFV